MVGNLLTVIEASARRGPVRGTSCTSSSRVILHTAAEHLTIEVVGELDRPVLREMLAVLLPAIRGGSRVVHLDLARVVFVSPAAIDALAAGQRQAAACGVEIVLLRPSGSVRRALEAALDLRDEAT